MASAAAARGPHDGPCIVLYNRAALTGLCLGRTRGWRQVLRSNATEYSVVLRGSSRDGLRMQLLLLPALLLLLLLPSKKWRRGGHSLVFL